MEREGGDIRCKVERTTAAGREFFRAKQMRGLRPVYTVVASMLIEGMIAVH